MTTSWTFPAFPSQFCPSGEPPTGDGIVLPESVLDDIKDVEATRFLFRVSGNLQSQVFSTPIRFQSGEDQNVFLPDWMFENLYLQPGDGASLDLITTDLPKATRLTLQPHDSAFLTLSDHKARLEACLAEFSTVTTRSVIAVTIGGERFEITVRGGEPEGPCLSLVDTDVTIDFEPPLDYVEERPLDWPETEPWPLPQGVRIAEERLTQPKQYVLSDGRKITLEEAKEAAALPGGTGGEFVPFSGKGHRLGS